MNLSIQKNINLKNFNTMAMSVHAQNFIQLQSEMELLQLLKQPDLLQQYIFILGGGSNILLTHDITGLVIHNAIKGLEKIKENDRYVWLKVAAGENWHQLVMYCVKHNYGGIENLALIPGTVGAAPIQNIGAYGVEVKDCFEMLEAYELTTGKKFTFSKTECEFSYRNSIFKTALKNQFIITHVILKLDKFPQLNFSYGAIVDVLHEMNISLLSIKVLSDAVIKIRQSKLPDPTQIPNTGSFFKNPYIPQALFSVLQKQCPSIPYFSVEAEQVKIPAGWLIEQCGWKGKMFGNVGVYDKQALVLINPNNGSAAEILRLVTAIQLDVKKKFAIELEAEVQII